MVSWFIGFSDMNINVWTALDKICHDEVVEISKRMAKKSSHVLTSKLSALTRLWLAHRSAARFAP
ncbi:hypothetical protein Rcae01_03461 [Novipirellula caenicola]|uniref:Uncharacterized protein n=1 Tax=Novipirellula caenicola TaxID=1536901 RepID=A0ABP9VS60_9BACT